MIKFQAAIEAKVEDDEGEEGEEKKKIVSNWPAVFLRARRTTISHEIKFD